MWVCFVLAAFLPLNIQLVSWLSSSIRSLSRYFSYFNNSFIDCLVSVWYNNNNAFSPLLLLDLQYSFIFWVFLNLSTTRIGCPLIKLFSSILSINIFCWNTNTTVKQRWSFCYAITYYLIILTPFLTYSWAGNNFSFFRSCH